MTATTIRLSVCSRDYRVAHPDEATLRTYRLTDPAWKQAILRSYRMRVRYFDKIDRRAFRAGLVFGLDVAGVEVTP